MWSRCVVSLFENANETSIWKKNNILFYFRTLNGTLVIGSTKYYVSLNGNRKNLDK
jgi:hypothetical protein